MMELAVNVIVSKVTLDAIQFHKIVTMLLCSTGLIYYILALTPAYGKLILLKIQCNGIECRTGLSFDFIGL